MHARPDGSLPPSLPRRGPDPFVAARYAAGLHPGIRKLIDAERQELVDRLDALDHQATEWLHARRAVVGQALEIHETLWPLAHDRRNRRPPKPGGLWLPPLPVQAVQLSGQSLRSTSQELLRRHGTLTLVELHTLLHVYGFELRHPYPVKALADAMAYETREGRCQRVARGVYRSLLSTPPRATAVEPPLHHQWRSRPPAA